MKEEIRNTQINTHSHTFTHTHTYTLTQGYTKASYMHRLTMICHNKVGLVKEHYPLTHTS